jgi:hypothetical protein
MQALRVTAGIGVPHATNAGEAIIDNMSLPTDCGSTNVIGGAAIEMEQTLTRSCFGLLGVLRCLAMWCVVGCGAVYPILSSIV